MRSKRGTGVLLENVCTIGQICEHAGCPRHRALYALQALSIEPVGRVGGYRVFSQADVQRVVQRIHAADEARAQHERRAT